MLSYGLVELTRAEASKISGGMLTPLAMFGVIAAGTATGVAAAIFAMTCVGLGADWLAKRFHH
jgi:hypothetical protein